MKFVRVSKIAEQLNMDITSVSKMVQKKMFDMGVYWRGSQRDEVVQYRNSFKHYHESCGGVVLIIDNNKLTYASEDFCLETYDDFYIDNFIKIKVKDFDIIYNNTVELSGEYTKEQLQEILNNMEE